MRVAVVHDWLVAYAGAERVLEQILHCFPSADLYSVVDFLPESGRQFIQNKPVHTTLIQNLPFSRSSFRKYLPLMPWAIERLDLSGYDLIISSSHAVAKGVKTRPDQLHVCYIYTPMRYAWDFRELYLEEAGLSRGLKGSAARLGLNYLRNWDKKTAAGVDSFISTSNYIGGRVARCYGRKSFTIYPPVDTDYFHMKSGQESFFLAAGRMVQYKRMGLIVEAFSEMQDKKLIVIGDGPEYDKIRSRASGNIEFLGYQPSDVLRDYMQRARAFVFAAEEDFGIMPLEAQACGTPVIAFGRGGALETVRNVGVPKPTGVFFKEQSVESLKECVEEFENFRFLSDDCRKNALMFTADHFKDKFKSYIQKLLNEFPGKSGWSIGS